MIKRTVIVMALYDIGRDNWDNFNLSYNTYLSWMKNSLSIDSYFVIYTEDKFYDKIVEYRKEFDKDFKKTIIVVSPLEELECYKKYNNRLEKVMSSDEFKKMNHHNVPEATKPLYNIIMFNKLSFLKHAKDSKYFDADLLIWADAGGLRNDIINYSGKIWPSLDKINKLDINKITFFSHTFDFGISDKCFHSMSQIRYIQGTSFFVPVGMIDDFVIEFNRTIEESLDENYIGSDEKVFDITYCRDKEKYNLIKSDWRTYFDLFKDDINEINQEPIKNVFLDLGTHNCQGLNHFIRELNIDPTWEIHTFEANPLINVYDCVKDISKYNINVHQKAVWVKNDIVIFKQYGDGGTSQGSLLGDTNGDSTYLDYYNQVEVESIDFVEFIRGFDIDCNIYIKMDIEYSEYKIIEYMLESGWPQNIKKIWVEWHNIQDLYFKDKAEKLIQEIKKSNTQIESWI